jgi:hypothetical protein
MFFSNRRKATDKFIFSIELLTPIELKALPRLPSSPATYRQKQAKRLNRNRFYRNL